jgi:Tfp pilus assembly protein PilO
MARSANVKIVEITPLASKQEPGSDQTYLEIPIMINAKSGYHELGKFIINLENTDRFKKIADMDVTANKTASKKHDVKLLILTYVLSENK